jgi:hypothetical protein
MKAIYYHEKDKYRSTYFSSSWIALYFVIHDFHPPLGIVNTIKKTFKELPLLCINVLLKLTGNLNNSHKNVIKSIIKRIIEQFAELMKKVISYIQDLIPSRINPKKSM